MPKTHSGNGSHGQLDNPSHELMLTPLVSVLRVHACLSKYCHGQCAFWHKFYLRQPYVPIFVTPPSSSLRGKRAGPNGCGWGSAVEVGQDLGLGGAHFWLALLTALVVRFARSGWCCCAACFLPCWASLLVRTGHLFGSCCAVWACLTLPETLFQTPSQVISRMIRPWLAARTPC